MDSLRDLLKATDPDLYFAFSEALKYFENFILPAMPAKADDESLNSQPHLKGNETYLNGILPVSEKLFDQNQTIYLSPVELYCILTATLLHDMGRISCGPGHGKVSRDMIIELIDKLRIPSPELAKAIGNICEIHEPEELKKETHPLINLNFKSQNIEVEWVTEKKIIEIEYNKRYPVQMLDNNSGIIRVNELGALLSLIDNMDATFRRLKQLNVIGKNNYATSVALIRNFIKGVSYDRDSQAVIVAIDENYFEETNYSKRIPFTLNGIVGDSDFINAIESLSDKKLKAFIAEKKEQELEQIFTAKECEDDSFFNFEWYLINGVYIKSIKEKANQKLLRKIRTFINDLNEFNCDKNKLDRMEVLKNIQFILPIEVLLPMILGNIRACHRSLKGKYKYLSRLGIPIKTWLIYKDEHLYNYYGEETYEPVFSDDYLKHLAKTMWELSTRVFGQTFFSYEMLASAANEKDLKKVKLGVKRLEVILRDKKNDEDKKGTKILAINYNANSWQLELLEKNNSSSESCRVDCYKIIEEFIGRLGEPVLKKKDII